MLRLLLLLCAHKALGHPLHTSEGLGNARQCNTTAQCREESVLRWNGDTVCEHSYCVCTEPLYGDRCQKSLVAEHHEPFAAMMWGFAVLSAGLAAASAWKLWAHLREPEPP